MTRPNGPADFWRRVVMGDRRACWPWGEPRALVAYQGTHWPPHRLAWTLTHGPIPEGLVVCHECDTITCCNPEHLWLGTQGQNVRDRFRKERLIKLSERAG